MSRLQVVAVGGCHSEDGIKLEEVVAAAGDAKLIMRGSLLSARQDASLLLTDFPIALLDPLLRRSPALQHAQPAVGGALSRVFPNPKPQSLDPKQVHLSHVIHSWLSGSRQDVFHVRHETWRC